MIEDFYSALVANATVMSSGATVSPNVSDDETLPSIVYTLRDGIRESFYQGSFGVRTTNIDVSIYSDNFTQVQEIKEALITAFHGFSGTLGMSTISAMRIINSLDSVDDGVHRAVLEFEIID